jgi:hypothetical protein
MSQSPKGTRRKKRKISKRVRRMVCGQRKTSKRVRRMVGGKTTLTSENTNIIQINKSKELEDYSEKLVELTKTCEPEDHSFTPNINEPYDIFWLVQYCGNGDIVGYFKSSDLSQYEADKNFEVVGGIRGKKGLQISGACNGKPDEYANLGILLLDNIEKYARDKGYQYILLHAGTDREYLVSDGSRKGLYIKAGFKKLRILEAGVGGLYDIDVFIMYKCLD